MTNNENRTANKYWSCEDREKLLDIRRGCNEAVKVVLADYNPAHNLKYVSEPTEREFLIMGKTFEEFAGAYEVFLQNKRQREFSESHFRMVQNSISDLIMSGTYKNAVIICRDNFPAKYAEPIVRILAHAAAKEAPLHRRSEELTTRVNHARERSRKIKEGIRALFDF